jgi:superfamily II DNA or RNA helicase
MPSIENVIFASPSKSKIRNLQSIGRGLRLNEGKTHCNLYDIADDLTYKSWKNHTLNHFLERVKLYSEEQFTAKIVEIDL